MSLKEANAVEQITGRSVLARDSVLQKQQLFFELLDFHQLARSIFYLATQ